MPPPAARLAITEAQPGAAEHAAGGPCAAPTFASGQISAVSKPIEARNCAPFRSFKIYKMYTCLDRAKLNVLANVGKNSFCEMISAKFAKCKMIRRQA